MKTLLKIGVCLLTCICISLTTEAQTDSKALKKELKTKVEKDCRKEAKQLAKEGWRVMPGKLSMEKQIQEGRLTDLSKDEEGNPIYLTATHQVKAKNYSAAQKIAYDRARQQLASSLCNDITALVKDNLAQSDLGDNDLELIDEYISSSQNLVSLSLRDVSTIVEIFREKDDITEMRVMLKIKIKDALENAKQILKQNLKKKSEDLAKKLDDLLYK